MTTFNVYRREKSDVNPPAVIATGLTEKFYSDSDIEIGKGYLYSIGAVKNGVEKISAEIFCHAGGDIYFSNVDLLIIADSLNAISTSIIDKSNSKNAINLSGDTKIVKSKFGNACAVVNQYARWSTTASALLTSDFTIEFWYHSTKGGINNGRLFSYSTSGVSGSLLINKTSNAAQTDLNVMINNGSWATLITTTGSKITGNEWQHVCLMRSNGDFYLFIDGVFCGSSTTFKTYSITDNGLSYNGWKPSASEYHQGGFGSCRVTKGNARYPLGGFTPPAHEFATSSVEDNIFNLVDILLIPSTSNMVDNSNNARVITSDGVAYFVPPPKHDDGTLFFDGDVDGLTSSIKPLGVGDFTLEFFINIKGSTKSYPRICQIGNTDSANGCAFVTSIGEKWGTDFHFWTGSSYQAFSGFSNLNKYQWYHICLMRKAGVFFVFVDGVLKSSNSSNPFLTYNFTTGFLMFGRGAIIGTEINCAFNSIRLTRVARYSEFGFNPPDSKLPYY